MELRRRIPLLILALLFHGPGRGADGALDLARENDRLAERIRELTEASEGLSPVAPAQARARMQRAIDRLVANDVEAALRSRTAPAFEREGLAIAILTGTALLQEAPDAAPPSRAVLRILDWLHLESPLQDLPGRALSAPERSWYRGYLTVRGRALAERLEHLADPDAYRFLRFLLPRVGAPAVEPLLRAGIAHRYVALRTHALTELMPPHPTIENRWNWPHYEQNEPMQELVANLWEQDPEPALRRYLDWRDRAGINGPGPRSRADLEAGPVRRVEQALEALDVPDPRYRWRSLAVLGENPASVRSPAFRLRVLALLAEDPSEPVRWQAARILFAGREADPAFLRGLLYSVHHDPSPAVRRAIAGLLAPLSIDDRAVQTALSRAYVQGRLPERNEWSCVDVFRF